MLRALVMLALVASPLSAQEAPHVGKWKVTFPAGMRVENGSATAINGTGTLTIERVNDSLIGTLVVDPIPDLPARPNNRMAAKADGGAEVTFTSIANGTVTINGEDRPITTVSTWKLQVKGDSLSGTVERRIQGAMPLPGQGPQPVTGVRAS